MYISFFVFEYLHLQFNFYLFILDLLYSFNTPYGELIEGRREVQFICVALIFVSFRSQKQVTYINIVLWWWWH